MKRLNPNYFRNIIFGVEDSLVSTVGVLFGVATAYVTRHEILLTGLIVVSVEALSMGVGSFLSETSTQEMSEDESYKSNPIIDGILMFFAYFIAGALVIFPYVVFSVGTGKYISLLLSLVSLVMLGYIPTKKVKSALRMAIMGGLAVSVGFLVAEVFKIK